jgi:hypothetical protein
MYILLLIANPKNRHYSPSELTIRHSSIEEDP